MHSYLIRHSTSQQEAKAPNLVGVHAAYNTFYRRLQKENPSASETKNDLQKLLLSVQVALKTLDRISEEISPDEKRVYIARVGIADRLPKREPTWYSSLKGLETKEIRLTGTAKEVVATRLKTFASAQKLAEKKGKKLAFLRVWTEAKPDFNQKKDPTYLSWDAWAGWKVWDFSTNTLQHAR